MKTAFLFPGQGAQCVGMGKDIYDFYEQPKKIYKIAEEVTGIPVKKLCFEGPEEELMKTENTQIAILTTSLAILAVLKEYGVEAEFVAGLSLGEYTALMYANYLSLEEGFKLIQKRGYYMGNFLPKEEYSMAAVIGLDSTLIEEACKAVREEQAEFVVPANYNCKVQTVVSGTKEGVGLLTEKLKLLGAKKVIPLKTSGPFHTEKLIQAKELFEKELEKADFQEGSTVQVIKNLDGTAYQKDANIKKILANHMINPVRFDKTIQTLQKEDVKTFIEIGPGKTLTGFVKKDYPEASTYNINNLETLKGYLEKLKDIGGR